LSKSKRRKAAGRRYARVQTRESWLNDLPLLPIVVGGVLLVGAIVIIVMGSLSSKGSTVGGSPIDNIQCQSNEQLAVHYHAHLAIYVAGNLAVLPAGVGIDNTDQCLYWMHVHQTDGVIHIEAPKSFATHKFTLGEFFDIWKKPLDSTHIGDTTLTRDQKLVIFVDGKVITGDPRKIVLGSHTQVTLEVTPPEINPPPTFTFPAGE
jgi:hypothetical protein